MQKVITKLKRNKLKITKILTKIKLNKKKNHNSLLMQCFGPACMVQSKNYHQPHSPFYGYQVNLNGTHYQT